jgi:hypothetical protein
MVARPLPRGQSADGKCGGNLVHALEFREVGHEHRRFHDGRKIESLTPEDKADILKHPAGLGADVTFRRLAGLSGIDRDLA